MFCQLEYGILLYLPVPYSCDLQHWEVPGQIQEESHSSCRGLQWGELVFGIFVQEMRLFCTSKFLKRKIFRIYFYKFIKYDLHCTYIFWQYFLVYLLHGGKYWPQSLSDSVWWVLRSSPSSQVRLVTCINCCNVHRHGD